MPTYKGRAYSLQGSPEEWSADDDGSLAPPDVAQVLFRRALRTSQRRLGMKPPGRPKKPQTKDERRLEMFEQGHTVTQIADAEGLDDEDTVGRSIRRGRQRRRGQ